MVGRSGHRGEKVVYLAFLLTCISLSAAGCTRSEAGSPATPDWEQTYEGIVVEVLNEGERDDPLEGKVRTQDLMVRITTGERQGERVQAEHVMFRTGGLGLFEPGDRVVLTENTWSDGTREFREFAVADAVRRPALYALGAGFVAVTMLVAGRRGVTALLGLGFTFVVVLGFILPALIRGNNPVWISVVGSTAILAVTLPLTHGYNRKTMTAVAGTAASLVLTGLLGWISVEAASLSGMTSDEAFYLQVAQDWQLNLKGIFLASVIIGALGVLDDVTVSQASVVFALRAANPRLNWRELYHRAMGVGRDHIASTVNTLVLAYAGASLPLLLIFHVYSMPWPALINQEIVAAEIVRTLAGSIGLMAAVPVTTALAVAISLGYRPKDGRDADRDSNPDPHGHHGHYHG